MASNLLIVPTVLTDGSLHFAQVMSEAVAQDVIDVLLAQDDVRSQSLSGLQDSGWALQQIRIERPARPWEVDELECLGDGESMPIHFRRPMFILCILGIIAPTAPVAPLLSSNPPDASARRHFSSFPMTSHLHNPVLRLVSLHPSLSLVVSFLRVPEIHDDFTYKLFVSTTMTVGHVIELVMEELGLTKSLPIPGGGNLEYVVEEVWADGSSESKHIDSALRSLHFSEHEYRNMALTGL